MNKNFLMTSDVETTSLVNHNLSDSTGKLVGLKAIPEMLELYSKYEIKSTFFITGYFAYKFPASVKMIYNEGHEIGCHGYSHKHDEAFDLMSLNDQIIQLKKAKDVLENIISDKVISFRAPALRTNKDTVSALKMTGFKIDSSIASQRFDFFLSLGSSEKIHWLTAPVKPYMTSADTLYKKGIDGIFEIPVSACIFPYIGTTMRVFPFLMSGLRSIVQKRDHVNFLIHPIELIEEKRNDDKINRRSANPIKYILSDVLRHKMKIKNIGNPAKLLLEKQIEYFKNKQYRFITCKQYMEYYLDEQTFECH